MRPQLYVPSLPRSAVREIRPRPTPRITSLRGYPALTALALEPGPSRSNPAEAPGARK
jgi:hypothetical protein